MGIYRKHMGIYRHIWTVGFCCLSQFYNRLLGKLLHDVDDVNGLVRLVDTLTWWMTGEPIHHERYLGKIGCDIIQKPTRNWQFYIVFAFGKAFLSILGNSFHRFFTWSSPGFHPGNGSRLARPPVLRPRPLRVVVVVVERLRAAGGLGRGRGPRRRAPRAARSAAVGRRGPWGCGDDDGWAAESGGLARGGVQFSHHEVSGGLNQGWTRVEPTIPRFDRFWQPSNMFWNIFIWTYLEYLWIFGMYSCKKCPIHWTLSTSNTPFFGTQHRRSVCWRKPWSPVATASGSSWTPPWNGPRCRGPPIPSSATSRTLRRPWPRAKRWGRGIPMAMHAIMEWMKGWKICDLEMIFGQPYLLDDFFGGEVSWSQFYCNILSWYSKFQGTFFLLEVKNV